MNDKEICRNFISAILLKAFKDYSTQEKSRGEVLKSLRGNTCKFYCNIMDLDNEQLARDLENGKIKVGDEDEPM